MSYHGENGLYLRLSLNLRGLVIPFLCDSVECANAIAVLVADHSAALALNNACCYVAQDAGDLVLAKMAGESVGFSVEHQREFGRGVSADAPGADCADF